MLPLLVITLMHKVQIFKFLFSDQNLVHHTIISVFERKIYSLRASINVYQTAFCKRKIKLYPNNELKVCDQPINCLFDNVCKTYGNDLFIFYLFIYLNIFNQDNLISNAVDRNRLKETKH